MVRSLCSKAIVVFLSTTLFHGTFAFVAPVVLSSSIPHRFLPPLCLSAADADYDLQRYRNRASLAESVLKQKVQELTLLRGKVHILQDVVTRLKTEQQALEQLVNDEKQTQTLLQEKLATLGQENESLRRDLIVATTTEEERRLESIEIASAAVRAAEMREKMLQEQLKQLQEQFDTLVEDKKQLVTAVEALQIERDMLEQNWQDMIKKLKTTHDRRIETMEQHWQDMIVQLNTTHAGQLETTKHNWQTRELQLNTTHSRKVDKLERQLESQRLAHEAARQVIQMRFDQSLNSQRDAYESQLDELRSMSMESDIPKDKQEQARETTTRIGFWKRLISPRKWISRQRKPEV